MANITREQINKLNSKCSNGFRFDLNYFLFHNEKVFEKRIKIGENKILVAKLMFYDRWDTEQRKQLNIPTIHLAEYLDKGSVMSSSGLGYFITIAPSVERKNTNMLASFTKDYDDAAILKMYEDSKSTKKNQLS